MSSPETSSRPPQEQPPTWLDEVERSIEHAEAEPVDATPLIVGEEPTAPTQPLRLVRSPSLIEPGSGKSVWRARASDLFWSGGLPLAVTLGALDRLAPSRVEAGAGWLSSRLAQAVDDHPLWVAVALFVSASQSIRYWRRRWRARHGTAATPGEAAVGRPLTLRRTHIVFWASALTAVAALALLTPYRLVEFDRVAGSSMVPTLNHGDRLLVNKVAYGFKVPFSKRVLFARPPRRGDLVVFPAAGHLEGGPNALVKRVIGLPGDVVSFRDGAPIVNGWVVPSCDAGPFLAVAGPAIIRGRAAVEVLGDRSYLTIRRPFSEPELANYRVPPGEVFVVGDDRGASSDSRTWNQGRGGGVAIESISGRVSRLAFPRSRDGRLDVRRPFAGLTLQIREPRVDLAKTQERIAACVAHPPKASSPPPISDATASQHPRAPRAEK